MGPLHDGRAHLLTYLSHMVHLILAIRSLIRFGGFWEFDGRQRERGGDRWATRVGGAEIDGIGLAARGNGLGGVLCMITC